MPFNPHKEAVSSEDLAKYVLMKDSELETDVASRLYGTTTRFGSGYKRPGYQILRDFYDGDQWSYQKEDGGTMRTYNYVFTTVENYTSFMANEDIDIDIDPGDPLDDEQAALASASESVVQQVLDANMWEHHFEDAVRNGSLLGDSIIVGPFWDKERKRIWFSNVRRPEFVRIIWSDTNYYEIDGFIMHYRVSVEEALQRYGPQLAARGINLRPDKEAYSATSNQKQGRGQGGGGGDKEGEGDFVTIRQYWNSKYALLLLGNDVLDFVVHDWGFVPIIYIRNIPHPYGPYGLSDAEQMLDPQVEYNETNSEIRDILRQSAFDTIFGKNLSGFDQVRAGVFQIVDVGDDAEILNDPRRTPSSFFQAYSKDRQQDVFNISGVPEVIFGGPRVQQATGRALSVLMQGVNNRVKLRQKRWKPQVIRFVNNIMRLLELYANAGSLFPDNFRVSAFFPSILVRDVTEEINKFNAKIQSLSTTQKNVGIPKPREEQDLQKKELSDTQLMLEIAKQPQLQMSFQQMVSQSVQGQRGNPLQPEAGLPQLQPFQNQGGESPIPFRGAPAVSPEGANAQLAQRGGAAVPA